MATVSREERQRLLASVAAQEQAELLAGIPLSLDQLDALLEQLGLKLASCDHTTVLTAAFAASQNLDVPKVLDWLAEQGGYCDCEVLANVSGVAQSLRHKPVRRNSKPKAKRRARSLDLFPELDLTHLPSPWRVANLYEASEPVRLQLGKKAGCSLTVIDSALSMRGQGSDEYWVALWRQRTDLRDDATARITRNACGHDVMRDEVIVEVPSWLPVYGWFVPNVGSWHFELRTDSNRLRGDLPQVKQLLQGIIVRPTTGSGQR